LAFTAERQVVGQTEMNAQMLLDALERTCKLLDESKESDWSPLTPAEVAKKLREEIAAAKRGGAVDRLVVSVEFAPTSTIQEIAMANGWHDEYERLAQVVDAYTGA
jgi:hypothetical protein